MPGVLSAQILNLVAQAGLANNNSALAQERISQMGHENAEIDQRTANLRQIWEKTRPDVEYVQDSSFRNGIGTIS